MDSSNPFDRARDRVISKSFDRVRAIIDDLRPALKLMTPMQTTCRPYVKCTPTSFSHEYFAVLADNGAGLYLVLMRNGERRLANKCSDPYEHWHIHSAVGYDPCANFELETILASLESLIRQASAKNGDDCRALHEIEANTSWATIQ